MVQQHNYTARIEWTGNRGTGTSAYRAYDRTWDIATPGKPPIRCSNDPLLGGDAALPNPEDLLLCSLSACHMLWYLHLASEAGIAVQSYCDDPVGIAETAANGAGRFLRATLKPHIVVTEETDLAAANAIHQRIHALCFVARSVNFPVDYSASYGTKRNTNETP